MTQATSVTAAPAPATSTTLTYTYNKLLFEALRANCDGTFSLDRSTNLPDGSMRLLRVDLENWLLNGHKDERIDWSSFIAAVSFTGTPENHAMTLTLKPDVDVSFIPQIDHHVWLCMKRVANIIDATLVSKRLSTIGVV